jgi:hypothetical protein
MENKHSTEIGECLEIRVMTHTDSRRRRGRFNAGRVLVLNGGEGGGGGGGGGG